MYFSVAKHGKIKFSHDYECWYDVKMLELYIYIYTSHATLTQVQTIFSFWRITPYLFMLSSCLDYRVNRLFKSILKTPKSIFLFHNFKCNQHNMAQIQTTFSFWRTIPNFFVSTFISNTMTCREISD